MEGSEGPSRWPDLPPELTCLVLRGLPWLLDRLSFRAVCRAWRLHLPPPLLCFNDGTFQSLTADEPPRLPFTTAPPPAGGGAAATATHRCCCCYDDWLLHCNTREGEATCSLFNPPSGATVAGVPLRRDDRPGAAMEEPMEKLIACSPNLLAALLDCGSVAFYRPGAPSWSVCPSGTRGRRRGLGRYLDVALYRGRIYALKNNGKLFFYDLPSDVDAAVVARLGPKHVIMAHPPLMHPKELPRWMGYLAISRGKLLMVRWRVLSRKRSSAMVTEGIKVMVFEADLENGRWLEVDDLDGRALFVGRGCSKALQLTGEEDVSIQGNRVYFLGTDLGDCCPWLGDADTPSYGFYDLRKGMVTQVFMDGRCDVGRQPRMDWFFPCV